MRVEDLSTEIKAKIPQEYWRIYLITYNNAWKDYDPTRSDGKSREEFAHQIALSAAYWPGQHFE